MENSASRHFFTRLTTRFLALDQASRAMQVAGLIRFFCIFLQGVILVKSGTPIQVVGQVELIFFVSNFFLFFWQNGAMNAMLSWASGAERTRVVATILAGMHVFACIATALMGIVMLFPVLPQVDLLLTGNDVYGLLLYVFFSVPSGAIIYAFLVRGQYNKILWFTGITQIIQVALVAFIVLSGYGISTLVWALALFAATRWLYVLLTGKWFSEGGVRRTGIGVFLLFAMPLILHSLNGGLMDYVDGWIVSLFYGDETFAVYRYGARELPFNALLIGGLMSGMIHRFKTKRVVDTSSLRVETLRIMNLLFPINCALILLSPLLYQLVYSDEFILSARIFNIYALTLLSRVIMNQIFCYVHHRNWVLMMSTAAEVVLNIILSLILMQWLGLFGIPLATVMAYFLQKVFLIWYVRTKFDVPLKSYLPIARCIWYFAVMIMCVVLSELIYF